MSANFKGFCGRPVNLFLQHLVKVLVTPVLDTLIISILVTIIEWFTCEEFDKTEENWILRGLTVLKKFIIIQGPKVRNAGEIVIVLTQSQS